MAANGHAYHEPIHCNSKSSGARTLRLSLGAPFAVRGWRPLLRASQRPRERTLSILKQIRRDIQAVYAHDPAARNTLEILLAYPGFHARELHRLSHTLWRLRLPVLPRLLSHVARFLTGVEIHPAARIGEGLFID